MLANLGSEQGTRVFDDTDVCLELGQGCVPLL